MKIVIANMPGVKVLEGGEVQHFVKAGSRWPQTVGYSKSVDYYPYPFWLGYTSALLKRDASANVKSIDGVVMDMTSLEFIEFIKKEKPDLVITELATLTIKDDLEFLKELKQITNSLIAVCGAFVTVNTQNILEENPHIDFVLIGEYELTAKELVEHLINKGELSEVLGLAYREKGEIKINERRPLISDLDSLPYPDREDFPPNMYPDFTLYSPCINLISSRGCPYKCIFCVERHVMYASPKYRVRDPKKVVDEMEMCIEKYGAKQFYFDDQSFVVNKKHVIKICNEIIERGLDIPWTCMGDAIGIDHETLKKMKEAGCIGMKFGVESANPQILKNIGKPLKLEEAKQVANWCKELGIRSHATFCIGLPGDNRETIMNSLKFVDELNCTTAQIARAIPYPGTPFFEWAKGKGYLITYDWSKYDGTSNAIVSYPELSNAELDELYEEFSKKVNRKKLKTYVLSPMQSFSIMKEIYKQKGFVGLINTVKTVARKSV